MKVTNSSVAILYLATMGRTMSSAGLDYWTNTGEYDGKDGRPSGTNLKTMEELSASFAVQAEYSKLYPNGTTNEVFINQIFQNLFQRDATSSYWAGEIEAGRTTRAEAVMSIISGAKGDDAKILENRATVAIDLADNQTLSTKMAQSKDIVDGLLNITANSSNINSQKEVLHIVISKSNIIDDVGTLSDSSTYGVSSIASKSYWDLTTDKDITYSFNTSMPSSYNSYRGELSLTSNWKELNREQKNAVTNIFNEVEKIINISFTEVADTSSDSDGDIQLNMVDMETNVAGFSFYPGKSFNYQGDIFLSNDFNKNPKKYGLDFGELGSYVIVHELGHALGLEHPFDSDNTTILPKEYDDVNHTVMSYTSKDMRVEFETLHNSDGSTALSAIGNYIEPKLYSLYDIETLQSVYGANLTTNVGDTVYKYKYTDYELNTIWDSGGIDTIDLSGTVGSTTLDLNSGSLNSVDEYTKEQIIKLNQNLVNNPNYNSWIKDRIDEVDNTYGLYTGKNNLGIVKGAIIENINSGLGDDNITDNEVNNHINTGGGDDNIYVGHGGYDTINGGEGNDTIYINLIKTDVTINTYSDNSYLIYSDNYAVKFTGVEQVVFSNGETLF